MDVRSFDNSNTRLEMTVREAIDSEVDENYIKCIKKILEKDFQENMKVYKEVVKILDKKRKLNSDLKISTMEATVLRCIMGGIGSVNLAQYLHFLVAIVTRYEAEQKIHDVQRKEYDERKKNIKDISAKEWQELKFQEAGENVQKLGEALIKGIQSAGK